jgi:hypothetical protein
MRIEHIPKTSLEWKDLSEIGMYRTRGECIEPSRKTPVWVTDYLSNIRSPSRQWPWSYAKALQSQKFAQVMVDHDPALAVRLAIAKEIL